MQMLVPYLQRLTARDSLSEIESQELFEILMTQDCPPEQVAGILVALNTKGIAADELVGFVKGLKRHALAFPAISDALVDTCGTGGGTDSFNISTGASIVVAAAGAKVAKHGNRAVSSRCGSADVLEALGVNVNLDAEQAHSVYEKTGMMFLFAPNLHPIMRKVGPIRRALGVRTIFNWLGPLANPAGAKAQLIGVYEAFMIDPMASALERLGVTSLIIANAKDGLDEISPNTPTLVQSRIDGKTTLAVLNPREFGVPDGFIANLSSGDTVEESAAILTSALDGSEESRWWALIPNAAAALYLVGHATDMRTGAVMAREAIRSGAAVEKLRELVAASNSV